MNLFKQTIFVYIIIFFGGIFAYLNKLIFAKSVNVELYGIFFATYSFIFFFAQFKDLGLTEATSYYNNKYILKKNYSKIKSYFLFQLFGQILLGIIFAIVLYLLKNTLIKYYFKTTVVNEIYLLLLVFFILQTILPTISSLYYTLNQTIIANLAYFLNNLLILIFTYLFLINKLSIKSLAYSYLLSMLIVSGIFLIILISKNLNIFLSKNNFNKKDIILILKYALPITFSTTGNIILVYSDIIILTIFSTYTSIANYNIALPVIMILFTFISPISTLLFTIISKYYHSKKYNEIQKVIINVYKYTTLLVIPIIIFYIIYSKEIILFLFGDKYIYANKTLIVFSIFFLFMSLRSINLSILGGIGKPKDKTIIVYKAAIFNLIGNLMVIPLYNEVGAAIVTGLGYLYMTYLSLKIIKQTINFKINFDSKIIIPTLIFILTILFLKKININYSYILKTFDIIIFLKLGIIFSIGFLIYIILSYKFNIISKNEISYLFEKILKKKS